MISEAHQPDSQCNGANKDAASHGINRTLLRCLAYLVIIAYVTISLLPLLSSGFYSDDLYNSTLKGQLELQRSSFFNYYLDTVSLWVRSNGRFLPVVLFITSSMSYLFYDVVVYKIILLVIVIINILLFGWLVEEITGNRYISFLAMILIPLMFQFRLYHDPVLSHYGSQQIYVSLVLCTIIYFNRFIQSNKYSCLLLSLLFYNIMLYTSELSIILISLFATVYLSSALKEKYRLLISRLWPFVLSALIALSMMIIARSLMDKASQGYAGIKFSLDVSGFARSLAAQLYATLPLSYYVSNPSHLFQLTISEVVSNIHLIDIAGLMVLVAGYLYAAENMKVVYNKYSVRTMVSLGVILTFCPAFLISLSAKYQKEFYLGVGYIQVYVQYYGAVLIGVASLMSAQHKIDTRQKRYALHVVMLVVVSVIFMLNAQNNRLVIEKSNIDMHYRRSALITALGENILGKVPENSIIYIKDEYNFDLYPQVYSDTRGWAEYGYPWKNDALVYMYAKKKMNIVTELSELKKYASGSNGGYTRTDNIYLLNIKSYPSSSGNREGFIILSKIENLLQDKDGNLHFQSQPLESRFPKEKS